MWRSGDLTAEAGANPLFLSLPPSLRGRAGAGGVAPVKPLLALWMQDVGREMWDGPAEWGVLGTTSPQPRAEPTCPSAAPALPPQLWGK